MRLFLVLLSFLLTSEAKPPSYSTYGFSYSPFPPPPDDQVLYEFAPVDEPKGKSRSTRDLNLDEYDTFILDGREPTCKELRQMWNLAKRIRQRAIDSNEIPSAQENPFTKEDDELKTDRRRMSIPTLRNLNRKSSEEVIHVRDPAKEIYGLLRERDSGNKVFEKDPVFGHVKTHSAENDEEDKGYFNILKEKMYPEGEDRNEDEFGSVRTHEPVGHQSSSFEKVRSILKASEDEGQSEDDPFEAIRQKLMSSNRGFRAGTDRLFRKGLRRKTDKQRRRNARDLALQQHLLQELLVPRASLADRRRVLIQDQKRRRDRARKKHEKLLRRRQRKLEKERRRQMMENKLNSNN